MVFKSTPRVAVSAMFALNGLLFGMWAGRVPGFVEALALEPADLTLVFLSMAAGAIVSFPLAGWASDSFGAARTVRIVAVCYALTAPLLATAGSLGALAALALLFGAGHGAMDVSMNAWGAEVERAAQRPIMAAFHAMWSLGAGVGAGSGFLAVKAGLAPLEHFALGALLAAALALWLARLPWQSQITARGTGFALPPRALLLVGVLAMGSSIGEGAMADWSAVFLIEVASASQASAALGFGVFSSAMVVARLGADGLVRRIGPVATARLGGALAALGLVVALIGGTLATGLAGFALVGFGYAALIPLAFSRAANQQGVAPGRAIAGVATLGYGGMLLGPVVVGGVAHLTSLPMAFALLALLAALIIGAAGALRPAAG
ncbi:MFS transporter [Pararhodobacter oceanensis]|uniref:MFS transporter n=1 Tax=Pararhodobacter oceanensis TaxID=2172121 RepID=UPI003A8EE4D7